jgi:radical SAM/Cys-rich protein
VTSPTTLTRQSLSRQDHPLGAATAQLQLLDDTQVTGARFAERAAGALGRPLTAAGIDVLQVNVGKLCNQVCAHCHVDAGPDRPERMGAEVAGQVLELLERTEIPTLDLTGGAPELNGHFRTLVEGASRLGRHVMDRCNLTVLHTPQGRDLPEFFAEHGVEVVCSLPHYRGRNTDRQRGDGVYEQSIEALKRLNAVGYGTGGDLRLVLVTNPTGAFLPAGQASLEDEWKRELERLHGVTFDALYTLANMPISRFLEWLERSGQLEGYLQKLLDAFNPATVEGLMCRTPLSVGWDGRLFDCDFNQMLELEAQAPVTGRPATLGALLSGGPAALERLSQRPIATARHCFGCTAGAGSSCGGSLA